MKREKIFFTFGKYKNQSVVDVPSDYLWWLKQEWCDSHPALAKAASEEWVYRDKHNLHEHYEENR